jgi:hypothetical protein
MACTSTAGAASVNAFFSAFLAIAILCGPFFEEVRLGRLNWGTKLNVAYVPLVFFGWLMIHGCWFQNWLRETGIPCKS